MNRHLVVMAGGSGTRFWPKSTPRRPKQFISFEVQADRGMTLLEQTLHRFRADCQPHTTWIVTTEKLSDCLKTVPVQSSKFETLFEPQGRNTAPCIYWAAREIQKKDPGAIMWVMPSDHLIRNEEAFRAALNRATALAEKTGGLVTLGIKPTRPETGYGYLKVKGERVEKFVEKPNLENAKKYFNSGEYLWNGGMFVWSVQSVLKAFDLMMPEMKKAWEESGGDVKRAYPLMTATSIDYGIMEKAENVYSVELDCGWDDLGSWISIESLPGVYRSPAGVSFQESILSHESSGNIIDVPDTRVALLGIKDLVIVQANGYLMIVPKDRVQEVKELQKLAEK